MCCCGAYLLSHQYYVKFLLCTSMHECTETGLASGRKCLLQVSGVMRKQILQYTASLFVLLSQQLHCLPSCWRAGGVGGIERVMLVYLSKKVRWMPFYLLKIPCAALLDPSCFRYLPLRQPFPTTLLSSRWHGVAPRDGQPAVGRGVCSRFSSWSLSRVRKYSAGGVSVVMKYVRVECWIRGVDINGQRERGLKEAGLEFQCSAWSIWRSIIASSWSQQTLAIFK